MANLRELSKGPEIFTPGHRLCAGCGAGPVVRQVLHALEGAPVVIGNATGCLEVASTIYPFTSWDASWIHNAFENAAATLSGVEAAYQSLKRQGKINDEIKFVAFGGDGGTYDIGLQSLSGAMERGHDLLYVCYDNGAYMNTGIQRSSATPFAADTTTSPVGQAIPGKTQGRKDLTAIIADHRIAYVAQASPAYWNDLVTKAKKAFAAKGSAFMNTIAPCPRGWRSDPALTVELSKLAVETCFWPLYEVENGKWRLTFKPREKKPITEWLKPQGRFKHLFRPENKGLLEQFQADVDQRWEDLLVRCGEK